MSTSERERETESEIEKEKIGKRCTFNFVSIRIVIDQQVNSNL